MFFSGFLVLKAGPSLIPRGNTHSVHSPVKKKRKKSYVALVKVTKAATWRYEDKMKAKCKLQHKVVKYERVRIP